MAPTVRAVSTFIEAASSGDPGVELLPQIVAKAIGESYLTVLAALYVLEERGVVEHWYGVYCAAHDNFITKTKKLEEARDLFRCRRCDRKHSSDNGDAYIELFFTLKDRPQLYVAMSEAA